MPKKKVTHPQSGIPRPHPSNKMVQMTEPNSTVKSTVSMSSVNLERINQKNADRLAKLENADNLGDSGFQLTMTSVKNQINQSPGLPRAINRDARVDVSRPPLPGSEIR